MFPDLDLVSIDMGYGHLRPAHTLSQFLGGQPVELADHPPLANEREQVLWRNARVFYETLSQAGRLPVLGPVLGETLHFITSIPPFYPRRDLSRPTLGTKLLARAKGDGLGAGLAQRLKEGDRTLLTTFYAPAILSDLRGCQRIYCVVTDSDVNRVWAREDARQTSVVYLAPTERVRRRLKTYGVPGSQIIVTGFPLPHDLVGGPDATVLKSTLTRRLAALDPKLRFLHSCRREVGHFLGEIAPSDAAPHLVFAVGGAGAQAELVDAFLPSLAPRLMKRRLRLTLVAGVRPEVRDRFLGAIERSDLTREHEAGTVRVLLADDHTSYFERFNELLADADILWTKPSELSFYGALGIPLLLAPPVGSHERYNQRWAESSGVGLRQGDPKHTGDWLWEMLKDGVLAGAAWTGYMRMPKFGLYRIVEELLGPDVLRERLGAQDLSRRAGTGIETPRHEAFSNASPEPPKPRTQFDHPANS